MSCPQFTDTIWCGTDYCESIKWGNSDRDIDLGDILTCPADWNNASYRHSQWERYPQVFKDVYRRICTRESKVHGNWKNRCSLEKQEAKYCPNDWCSADSRNAIAHMTEYCKIGNRIFDDGDCNAWKLLRPVNHKAILKSKCTIGNLKRPACQQFCKNNAGECRYVKDFCDLHPTDPLCSCIHSPLNRLPNEATAPAVCFDQKCQNLGYKSRDARLVAANCPDNIDCRQIIKAGQGAVLDGVVMNQNCSIEIAKDQSDKAAAAKAAADKAAAEAARRAAATRDAQDREAARLAAVEASLAAQRYAEAKARSDKEAAKAAGPFKKITDIINKVIPDTNIVIGGVEIDDIKPLLLVFMFILVVAIIMTIIWSGDDSYGVHTPQYQQYQY